MELPGLGRVAPDPAFLDGIRRATRAPAVLAGVWLVTVLAAIPLTLAVRDSVEAQLGGSVRAETIASGADYDWMQEFSSEASGAATTLGPAVLGFAVVLDNVSGLLDRAERPAAVAATTALYLGVLIFLQGGAIDRLARDRPTGAAGFFAAGGVFFFRFVRLGVVAAIVYGVLFGIVHPWLFDGLFFQLTSRVSDERPAFVVRIVLYAGFVLALAACNVVFDYAKVRAVIEDRRSAAGALAAALRFLGRHGAAAAAIYVLNAGLLMVVFGIYALVAPGAGSTGPSMWIGFAVSQIYLVGRVWVKLVLWASEAALFQSRLAHAGYTARLAPAWPESPAVESVRQIN